jgi:hypothetical protein
VRLPVWVGRALPWRHRAVRQEARVRELRHHVRRVHDDWIPLGHALARIDREIEINDWTATAKRIFGGRG